MHSQVGYLAEFIKYALYKGVIRIKGNPSKKLNEAPRASNRVIYTPRSKGISEDVGDN